jgi:hypothetical protein
MPVAAYIACSEVDAGLRRRQRHRSGKAVAALLANGDLWTTSRSSAAGRF